MDKLAIHGGTPIRTREWVSKYMGSEELGAEEKERVLRVLEKKRVFRYFPEGLKSLKPPCWKKSTSGFWEWTTPWLSIQARLP